LSKAEPEEPTTRETGNLGAQDQRKFITAVI
jgi:hypothetical protein